MSWWGKIIGGGLGFMMGGPLGAMLGTALGHQFDRGIKAVSVRQNTPGWDDHERIQTVFFTATFSVMGYIAKADGRVSEDEIAFARAVMDRMSLNSEQRKLAIDLFREGKQPGFDLPGVVEQFRRECHRRQNLIQMFLEIQLQSAYADGKLDHLEHDALLDIGERLGVSRHSLENLIRMVDAARNFRYGGGGAYREQPTASPSQLHEAYALLGVDKGAEDGEVKRAYRRLMNQHHPDKLVSKGLPDEMIKLATEKVQEIKAAYELVKKSRGMR